MPSYAIAGSEAITVNGWAPLAAVYTSADLGGLLPVAAADGNDLYFASTASVTYIIAVYGADGGSGQYSLRLELARPPSNDHFANRLALAGPLR